MTYELRKTDENVLIAEGASVTGDVRLAKGVSIWYGAVLRGDMGPITVGADTNIQDGAILHEETVVGRGCTIGHGAIVHGCTVGDNTLIGMGAIVLNGAKIGSDCIVGRGPGHRKNGRPGRVHDPGQPRQGGAAPEAGGDRRQPGGHGGVSGSCRPVSEGAGSPLRQALRAGKRVYRSWNGTNRRSKDFCWCAAVWRFTAHCSAWMQSWRRWAGCLGFWRRFCWAAPWPLS
jgi:hypothetical protein